MKNSILTFVACILGAFIPLEDPHTNLIRYNLMIMLFFSFVDLQWDIRLFNVNQLKVLIANLLLPIIFYFLLKPFDTTLALTAFIISIAPTAAAAPAIAYLLKVPVEELTFSVILTNPIVACLLPFLLPFFGNIAEGISVLDLALPVLSLVFIPLILGQMIKKYFTPIKSAIQKLDFIPFPLFLLNIFISCGNASYFIRQNQSLGINVFLLILLLTTVICIIHYQLGGWIGKKDNPLVYSLALGRKNTMFSVWVAMTYFEPVIALGSIFYIIVQNIYNSVQIWEVERKEKKGYNY